MMVFCFSSAQCLCLSFALVSLLFVQTLRGEGVNVTRVPAVIVFGDSVVDPGNNNDLQTVVKANFPPYGRDFNEQKPTGRFSNGKIPSDLIGSALGIKDIVPAYLDPELNSTDLLTGVSFASGGAGYDPYTAKSVSVLSLEDQKELFKEYLSKLESIAGVKRAGEIVSESVYIIVVGSNDWGNTYFPSPLKRAYYDVPSYTDYLLEFASNFIQELYELGARKIGVAGLPPLGCLPSQITLTGRIFRECNTEYNQVALFFNSKLSQEIEKLCAMLPGSNLIYFDIYSSVLNTIYYPSNHGFEVTNKGCCGTGRFEVSIFCTNMSPHTCTNASNYVFWDSFHPTEKTYKIVVDVIAKDGLPRLMI